MRNIIKKKKKLLFKHEKSNQTLSNDWPIYCHTGIHNLNEGRRGCDRMVVGLTVQSMPITTKVVSLNPVHGVVYSIQLYVRKVCELQSNLQHVGFLQVL